MEILRLVPKNLLSQLVGQVAQVRSPNAFALKLRDWFIKKYKINMEEAELPLEHYTSLSSLFTRKLKEGARPIGSGLVHPCDGELTVAECIEDNRLIQAKGRNYSLPNLINDTLALEQFRGGSHLVYYLCPTDYHRVHAPVDGEITSVIHVPGHLWPVNQWSVNRIDDLFVVNERVIFNFKTPLGPVALVMVGATNVGKISVSFDEGIKTNQLSLKNMPMERSYNPPKKIQKGDEIGVFNMGSTVVMVYGPQMINVLPKPGTVRMGRSL